MEASYSGRSTASSAARATIDARSAGLAALGCVFRSLGIGYCNGIDLADVKSLQTDERRLYESVVGHTLSENQRLRVIIRVVNLETETDQATRRAALQRGSRSREKAAKRSQAQGVTEEADAAMTKRTARTWAGQDALKPDAHRPGHQHFGAGGGLSSGPAAELFERIAAGHTLLVSSELLEELSQVLGRDWVRRVNQRRIALRVPLRPDRSAKLLRRPNKVRFRRFARHARYCRESAA